MSAETVAIIGAGVVGCAIARALALSGLEVVVLERGADILSGASKANSAILHTGFDAPPGSLELACMQRGYAEYLAIREGLNLPLLETGAHVVAWTEAEAEQLDAILAKARANGVEDAYRIDPATLYAREPQLAPGARGAIAVPGEHVIDPWSAPLAYARQAIASGAHFLRRTEVFGAEFHGDEWHLATTTGPVTAHVVINAAGLQGDHVEALARPPNFRILPRRGQFVVFDKSAAALVRSILLPVPTERTKGVVICRTIFGNLLVGPTAEEVEEREHPRITEQALLDLLAAGRSRLPALATEPVTAAFAGLRPATDRRDYIIEALPDRNWITVAGIRSTGLTAALGIAAHVRALHEAQFRLLGVTPLRRADAASGTDDPMQGSNRAATLMPAEEEPADPVGASDAAASGRGAPGDPAAASASVPEPGDREEAAHRPEPLPNLAEWRQARRREEAFLTPSPIASVPNLAEHLPRAVDGPAPGEIVCHCELVTRAEIEAALRGILPAGDIGGLRRRTRAMMGRCQGFYCTARVAALAPALFGVPPIRVR